MLWPNVLVAPLFLHRYGLAVRHPHAHRFVPYSFDFVLIERSAFVSFHAVQDYDKSWDKDQAERIVIRLLHVRSLHMARCPLLADC
ncbi:hypothetical protein Q5W_13460 [Hydrogenophaga sp. PBC]|nr:hypothetical protein Q5W_13460 [Hydrogenophaga sp. PBC]